MLALPIGLAVLAILTTGRSLAAPIWHPNKSEIRKLLLRQYAQIGEAYKKKDAGLYGRLLTSDFSRQELNGHLTTRREELITFKRTIAKLKAVHKTSFVVEKLNLSGRQAIVTVRAIVDATAIDVDGLFGPKGKPFRLRGGGARAQDSWIKTRQGWLLHHARTL